MATYRVYVLPVALREIDRLPGMARSRVRRAILALRNQPAPPHSRPLSFVLPEGKEIRRVRLDDWRLVYLIDGHENAIYVLAVRHRPPYAYEDLALLTKDFVE